VHGLKQGAFSAVGFVGMETGVQKIFPEVEWRPYWESKTVSIKTENPSEVQQKPTESR